MDMIFQILQVPIDILGSYDITLLCRPVARLYLKQYLDKVNS